AEALVHPSVGYFGLAGLTLHTFFDGVAIASGFLVSRPLGVILFAAVVLHKLPEGFAVGSLMLAAGGSRRAALTASGLLGLATLVGAVCMTTFTEAVGPAMAVSAGVTIYVAASDLIPEVNRERSWGVGLAVFGGVLLYYVAESALEAAGFPPPRPPGGAAPGPRRGGPGPGRTGRAPPGGLLPPAGAPGGPRPGS